jgi:hypothetical protein
MARSQEKDLLAALSNHAHRWFAHAVNSPQRQGVTIEVKPVERLGDPIFAYGSPDALHQFLAIGLHPPRLAFFLLVVHDIHSNLFSGFSIIHRDD